MIRADNLDAEAHRLMTEADEMHKKLREANLRHDQFLAACRAMVDPRERAADAIKVAANALRAIPPLALDVD